MPSAPTAKTEILSVLFDLDDLGEGNPVAGLNTLTMMALTLANIVPSDSRLNHKTGSETIGCGFLAAGPLATSHFNEVFDVLLEIQNNIVLNKEVMLLAVAREAAKPNTLRTFEPGVMDVAPKYPPMLSFLDSDQQATALEILFEPPPFMPELVRRPLVVVKTSEPRQLLTAAASAHSGRLLAAVPVATAQQAVALGRSLMSLRDGVLVTGQPIRTTSGCISASIGFGALASGISSQHNDASWLTTLPWLCDSNDDMSLPECDNMSAKQVWLRFRKSVRTALRHRLNGQPLDIETTNGCRDLIARYVGFLGELEPLFPGISGVARKLAVSLAYGLLLLYDVKLADREVVIDASFSAARLMVKRMASVRTQIDDNSEARRLRVLAVRIAGKLEAGPCDERALTRKCHRVRIGECRDALTFLRDSDCAVERDSLWVLTRPAADVASVIGKVLDV